MLIKEWGFNFPLWFHNLITRITDQLINEFCFFHIFVISKMPHPNEQ